MIAIFSKFLNLDAEKQERIINSALKEFAKKGFDKASTNTIVKDANISKGLLFHYFNNKKDLFLFLYDYCVETLFNEFYGKIDVMEKDILLRLQQMAMLKFELIKKHPEMFDFVLAAFFEESDDVKQVLDQKKKDILASGYAKLFADFDVSKFREGIDIKKAIDVIIWTLEGLSKQGQEKLKIQSFQTFDYEQVIADMDGYLEVLKNSFYK